MKKYKRIWSGNWKILIGIGILVLVLILGIWGLVQNQKGNGSDFKIGIVADDGVELVSISPDRKMINILDIDPETKLWIVGGLGWYRSSVIKKVLLQEKKMPLSKQIFFYNFGFVPDKILMVKNKDDWKKVYWLRYRLVESKMLIKKEYVKGDITLQDDFLNEIMVRDFAETDIVKQEIKMSIFNLSEMNGLAGFVAKRFEWMGGQVVTVENISDESFEKCLVKYGSGISRKSASWLLVDSLSDCDKVVDNSLGDNEIEYYVDDSFGLGVNYPSYK